MLISSIGEKWCCEAARSVQHPRPTAQTRPGNPSKPYSERISQSEGGWPTTISWSGWGGNNMGRRHALGVVKLAHPGGGNGLSKCAMDGRRH